MKLGHLTTKLKIAYALPAFALAVIGIPVYVYIPKFYSDIIGINIGVVGIIIFSVRIFDAVTDPLIGAVSDRTKSKYGRRRPYILVGTLFLAIALYFLFNPMSLNKSDSAIWLGVFIYLLFIFWTIVTIPYESLGPEITDNYNERSVLYGVRDGFLIGGTLFAAASPLLVKTIFNLGDSAADEKNKFFIVSLIYIPLLIVTSLICILKIKEHKLAVVKSAEKKLNIFHAIIKNKPFLILLISFTISSIAYNLPAALILYYVEYVLQSDKADLFLFEYFVTGVIFLPFWIQLAKKYDKKIAWIITMCINTGAFIGVYFLDKGDTVLYAVLVFFSGIGFGAATALPSAIQADVIDYDELLTGKRNEGKYLGIWSVSKKLTAAFAVGISYLVLGSEGYKPRVEQSEEVIEIIKFLYALLPSICSIIAIAIAGFYPLSREKHFAVLTEIDKMKSDKSYKNPLLDFNDEVK